MYFSAFLRPLILLSVLAAAAATDTARRKVYNILILAGFAGEAVMYLYEPPAVESKALVYLALFIAMLIAFFCLKMLGAADVKLYMLIAFAYPNAAGLKCAAISIVLSAAFICTASILRHQMPKSIPMGIFIFAGTLLTLLKG